MDLETQYEKLLRYCYMKTKDRYIAEDIDNMYDLAAEENLGPEKTIDKVAIESALDQLSEELKEIIMLRFTNEMKVTDIAKIAGVSRFVVHRRIKEGLNLLRNNMEGAGRDD